MLAIRVYPSLLADVPVVHRQPEDDPSSIDVIDLIENHRSIGNGKPDDTKQKAGGKNECEGEARVRKPAESRQRSG
jgi:hypothetical protein